MLKNNVVFILFMTILLSGCIEVNQPFKGLPPGEWRAVLKLDGLKLSDEEVTKETVRALNLPDVKPEELPINFSVVYDTDSTFHIVLKNGTESIIVDDITMAWDNQIGKDTLTINFPVYGTYIKGIYAENIIDARWYVPARGDYSIPFIAHFGQNYRFSNEIDVPATQLSGKWEVQFGVDTDEPYPAIGEFQQDGKNLTGTFLTETGDYRFLQGEVVKDKMYLSCFDGAHAFLFEGKLMDDGQLTGVFRSGKHYKTIWSGKRNEQAKLSNPDQLTFLKDGYHGLQFSFEDLNGNLVTSEDKRFDGKVRVFQIMGTWCPNCRDETLFLNKYLKEHPSDQLEVVGLAFEKQKNKMDAFRVLNKFKKRLNVQYDILLGSIDKSNAEEKLPMLNHIMSFPTMIIEDKEGYVHKIHTGFSGPATSEYETFEKEFTKTLQDLLTAG